VLPLLRRAGHHVYAPTLTGLGESASLLTPHVGLDTHIQDVVKLLQQEDLQQVILVGHSYSGMVITGAADAVPERIKSLVYLDAVVPHDGDSMAAIAPFVVNMLRRDANKKGDGWRVNPPRARPAVLGGAFGITQEPDLSMVRAKVTPQPLQTFIQPLRLTNREAAASIKRTFIQCTGGGPIRSFLRHVLTRGTPTADEPGWRVRRLPSGHDAMIIAPRELTDLLLELA
jgi:pimeloyl-ACP methyl ester carboxylesterase